MDWRGFGTDEIEALFNPRAAVASFEADQARHGAWSAAARAAPAGHLDVAYGDGPLHKVDVFPAGAGTGKAPIHVYFHGGYWRAQDKANFAHVANTLVREGICTVIANYDLCPAATLDGTSIRRSARSPGPGATPATTAPIRAGCRSRVTRPAPTCARWRSRTTGPRTACRRT
jgi:hypothetical protein